MTQTILLCEDDIHILKVAEFKFKGAGYDVVCTDDGQEAWEHLQDHRADLLITDCQMPRLDGLGLVQRIRGNPETEDLRVVMLTAKGFELAQSELSDEWGVIAVLPKPFTDGDLLGAVAAALTIAG